MELAAISATACRTITEVGVVNRAAEARSQCKRKSVRPSLMPITISVRRSLLSRCSRGRCIRHSPKIDAAKDVYSAQEIRRYIKGAEFLPAAVHLPGFSCVALCTSVPCWSGRPGVTKPQLTNIPQLVNNSFKTADKGSFIMDQAPWPSWKILIPVDGCRRIVCNKFFQFGNVVYANNAKPVCCFGSNTGPKTTTPPFSSIRSNKPHAFIIMLRSSSLMVEKCKIGPARQKVQHKIFFHCILV